MSMDISHRDNSQQQQSSITQSQPVLLLPPSTTGTIASANTAPGTYNSNINITSSPIVTTSTNNSERPLSSPSTPASHSWLNSINDYRNDDDNNDNNDNGSNEIIARPAPIRKPHGSGLSNLGNTCFMVSIRFCRWVFYMLTSQFFTPFRPPPSATTEFYLAVFGAHGSASEVFFKWRI